MAAEIRINGSPGSNDNITLGATVTLSNTDAAASYLWSLLSQPSGSPDAVLSSTSASAVTFTANKEGSYLVRLVTDVGLPTESRDQVIVAVRELQTGNRVPAAGETLENNDATGWANTAVDLMLRRVTRFTDAGVVSGVAAEELLAGDVVYPTGYALLAAGLPGQRVVPQFASAAATSSAAMAGPLGVVLGSATGASTVASGQPLRVQMAGPVVATLSNSMPLNSPVYVDDDGYMSQTPGTIVRQVGRLFARAGGSEYVWVASDPGTSLPARATALGAVQLAGGLGGTGSTATAPKLDMDHAVSGTLAAARQAPQTLVGDVDGTTDDNEVVRVRGFEYDTADPAVGQVPTWNGTKFVYASVSSGGSGGGGVIYYLNNLTAGEAPITGLNASTKTIGLSDQPTLGTVTSGTLPNTGTYVEVAWFVTAVGQPGALEVPAGVWDFNVWANGNTTQANEIGVRAKLYKYNGTTATLLATSTTAWLTTPGAVSELGGITMGISADTPLLVTDRLYVVLEATATANNRTVTLSFGNGYPTHVHTTLPSVTGTGIVTVVNGVFQSPAGPLALNSSTYVTGVLAIANGGTGLSSAGGTANRVLLTTDGTAFSMAQVPNAALANSSVTVATGAGLTGGGTIALGGSITVSTDGGVKLTVDNILLDDPSDQIPTDTGWSRVVTVTTMAPPLVLTSTPTINTTGVPVGTVLVVTRGAGPNSFTISADSAVTPGGVAGTAVVLKNGATSRTFDAYDSAQFIFDGSFWIEL